MSNKTQLLHYILCLVSISEMMSMGYSKPWPQVIKILTGGKTSEIDARPLIEYFKPLTHWLINENKAERIGWSRLNEDIGNAIIQN